MPERSFHQKCQCKFRLTPTFFNKGWLDFTGRTLEQELGRWTKGLHPDDRSAVLASYSPRFDARSRCRIEHQLRQGRWTVYRWLLCEGVPHFEPGGDFSGYIGSAIDTTDIKRAQSEALSRQKLEGLRVLSGGIAHDLNNLLGGILAEAELMEAELDAGSALGRELRRIKAGAIRGAKIVRELMLYAGQGQTDLVEAVDLSRLVEEMLALLKISISKFAALRVNPSDLTDVLGNAGQIRQVVMNLVVNASEALDKKGGVITVTVAGHSDASEFDHDGASESIPSSHVRLEVSDTGIGIPEEARTKTFDPFFSTKFGGRGLGLAVVQGIVRAHGGAIQVASKPGRGTTFQILRACTPKKPVSAVHSRSLPQG